MKNWFKDWFASDYYLTVYSHRNSKDAQELLDLILSKVKLHPGAKVLDAACGAGRHSIPIASKGFNVTGFDLSLNLLKVAQKTAHEKSVKIDLINADIRKVIFKTKFDLIINLFTSFGYFESDEENLSFIKSAYNYLRDDHFFIFDYLNKSHVENNLIPFSEKEEAGLKIYERRSIENDRVVKQISIEDQNRINYIESVKLYESEFLIEKFKSFGYKIFNLYGDYSGRIFDEKKSPRLLIFLKK